MLVAIINTPLLCIAVKGKEARARLPGSNLCSLVTGSVNSGKLVFCASPLIRNRNVVELSPRAVGGMK